MFGHERGAFTGAVGARMGMFQLANGGTIFLDEVGEMSPPLQVKLLRVLQDREIRPVGADRAVRVDVRVLAATNKDLAVEVEKNRFRELWEYDWPGNVRELENLVERLVVLSEDGRITVENLPPNIRSFISDKKIPRPQLTEEGIDLNAAVEEFEYRLIDEALRRTKGNKQAAARLLGLKRTTLVAKLRRKGGVAGADLLDLDAEMGD
jgi:transcriptional regulator with GAF, ATPase, and Fis domain